MCLYLTDDYKAEKNPKGTKNVLFYVKQILQKF